MKVYDKQYINGEWRVGTGSATLKNVNPYTGEVIYTYQSASQADVDDAYAAAKAAQKAWAALLPGEKRAYFDRLETVIAEMRDEVFSLLREEAGCIVPKADFEFNTILEFVRQCKTYPYLMEGKIMTSDLPGKTNYVYRQPKGVICVIAPWNVPLVLAVRSVIPAIATGNTVVLKPSSDTPGSAFLIAEMLERAGFPKGVFNAVAGRGGEIGDYIVTHPVPALVSFTGSTEVGRRIGELAGKNLKEVSLELGGNNAMIVLKDADIDAAASAAIFGSFFHQGQVCMALNRVIAEDEVYDEFVEKFVEKAAALKCGDPADPDVFVGPIINEGQRLGIEKLVEDTLAAGATAALKGYTEGNVMHPWILSDVTNDMPAAKNEVFGPVCSVIRALDEKDAIRLANDTEYGLSGSLFTTDVYHGMQIARELESGMLHINDQSINDEPHVMFGGEKASGIGRFNAKWVQDKFTTDRWISVQETRRF